MNPGSLMSWVKFNTLIFLGFFSISGWAQNCPPVLRSDSEIFSTLQVSSVDAAGKISSAEKPLNFKDRKGQVSVVRLFATWCPYCKRDIQQLDTRFSKLIEDKKVDVSLVMFQSRRESEESIELFLKQGTQELGVEKKKFKWLYSRVASSALKEIKSVPSKQEKAELLFPGFQGVPYALVFDSQGRLRFSGHFTGEDEVQNKHYEMISALATGKCG